MARHVRPMLEAPASDGTDDERALLNEGLPASLAEAARLHGATGLLPRDAVINDDPLAGRLAVPLTEAARLLGISPRHARNLVAEGVIEVVELGCKRVVPVPVLRRLLGQATD